MRLPHDLQSQATAGARVEPLSENSWRLVIPPGPAGEYRLAQLDDYHHLARSQLKWNSPSSLQLRARVSHRDLPGTWGFGWWNDPFPAGAGLRGAGRWLPALPHAAWFFHASPPNFLTLRDGVPGQGFLAAAFSSRRIPAPLLAMGAPLLPMLLFASGRRTIRRLLGRIVSDDAVALDIDPVQWHTYAIEWQTDGVRFRVDGGLRFHTRVAPSGPLALVIWIDNQFAGFSPAGHLGFGTLELGHSAWLEIDQICIDTHELTSGSGCGRIDS